MIGLQTLKPSGSRDVGPLILAFSRKGEKV